MGEVLLLRWVATGWHVAIEFLQSLFIKTTNYCLMNRTLNNTQYFIPSGMKRERKVISQPETQQ